jgi:hypothetical protein
VQVVLATLAAFAFARYRFRGQNVAFALVLVQLMVMPGHPAGGELQDDGAARAWSTRWCDRPALLRSAFAIFLLRQTFMGIPKELGRSGAGGGRERDADLWRVYVPLARPVYTAFALVSVSFHWNNFLWPLIITNSVNARPAHRRAAGVLVGRPGGGLVDHHGCHAHDFGAAADRLPAVPAPVRAELHAGRASSSEDHAMKLVTWNTQWCCGIDGVVSPERIVRSARAMADFDVLCLQEIAVNYPRLAGNAAHDQPGLLAALLPGFQLYFGAAVDEAGPGGARSRFGNLVATRPAGGAGAAPSRCRIRRTTTCAACRACARW